MQCIFLSSNNCSVFKPASVAVFYDLFCVAQIVCLNHYECGTFDASLQVANKMFMFHLIFINSRTSINEYSSFGQNILILQTRFSLFYNIIETYLIKRLNCSFLLSIQIECKGINERKVSVVGVSTTIFE